MEDRTRRIVVGIVLTAGALTLSAATAGAQGTGSSPAPATSVPFDDAPSTSRLGAHRRLLRHGGAERRGHRTGERHRGSGAAGAGDAALT